MTTDSPIPDRVGSTYRVEGVLGRGGTSRVLRVFDERSGRRFALKQAIVTGRLSDDARTFSLFRQEYHVLTQIAHPNVVAVLEFGFDNERPFYTMEMLEGQSVHELAPLPWPRICQILLDLCSPLSMLHARRFVHCDVTARNVFVTSDGTTKLIDFGALAAIDHPISTIVGTPPYMTPELLHGQSLDGRVDMFALGALAYWALSGRHAYPARTLHELPQIWKTTPHTLLELGVEVPAALDRLIMSLLSLEVEARPLQLAEIVHRLATILGTHVTVDANALRAQIATPKLIGREAALAVFRSVHVKADNAQGDVICISGPNGIGRSRLLEACALEAILAGSFVIRVACEDGASVPFGLLARTMTNAIYQDATLLHTLPTELRAASATEAELARALESASEADALQFWIALCSQRTVVMLIDDLGRADVQSIQLLLSLADACKRMRLALVSTIGAGDTRLERELASLLQLSQNIQLAELNANETLLLLRSLFGDSAGLEQLAEWVHRVGAGVPLASVDLAHYAVESGVVEHVGGQFVIADRVETIGLPKALDEAVASRIAALDAVAKEVLGALSLVTAFGPLSAFQALDMLCTAGWARPRVLDALDQLRDARLILVAADGYKLGSESVQRRAAVLLDPAKTRVWHARLAAFYDKQGDPCRMLCALHSDYAGDHATAYAQLIQIDAKLRSFDDPNIKLGGSPLGIALHEAMLAHAIESHAPRVEVIHFQRVLLRIGAVSEPRLGAVGKQALAQLHDDTGLDFWDEADPALAEHERMLWCLGRAHERFTSAPPGERLPVFEAVKQFGQSVSAMSSIYGTTCDAEALTKVVESLHPLRTLAPVLALTYDMLEASARSLARGGRETCWPMLLAALEQRPEGLPELIRLYMVGVLHFRQGRDHAVLGSDGYAVHAEYLAAHRRTSMQASSLRLLHALAHGSMHEASRQRRERAIATLASGHEDQLLVASHVAEIGLLDACGDILELQRAAARFEARAARYPGWSPFATIARACSLLLCDEGDKAEPLLAAAIQLAPPLRHGAWYALRALRAEAALQRGKPQLAIELADDVLRIAREANVDLRPDTRAERVAALACAQLGDIAAALARLQPLLSQIEIESTATVHAGGLYEARARIALMAAEWPAFDAYYARVKTIYSRGMHPGLTAKLQRLASAAERRAAPSTLDKWVSMAKDKSESVQTQLDRLNRSERFDYLLELLLRDGKASAGHLYAEQGQGKLARVATRNTRVGDAAFDMQVNACALALLVVDDDATQLLTHNESDSTLTRELSQLERERYAVVILRAGDHSVRGLALLRTASDTATAGCSPGLCAFVADVLGRLSVAA